MKESGKSNWLRDIKGLGFNLSFLACCGNVLSEVSEHVAASIHKDIVDYLLQNTERVPPHLQLSKCSSCGYEYLLNNDENASARFQPCHDSNMRCSRCSTGKEKASTPRFWKKGSVDKFEMLSALIRANVNTKPMHKSLNVHKNGIRKEHGIKLKTKDKKRRLQVISKNESTNNRFKNMSRAWSLEDFSTKNS